MTDETKSNRISRRRFLQTSAAAAAGAAAGSGIIGMPTIWAQNIKDVTINWVGPSFSVISDIADRASKDLGFKVVAQVVDSIPLMSKIASQPDTIDVVDFEDWALAKVWRANKCQPVDISRIKLWDKLSPIQRDGIGFDGQPVSRQGASAFKVGYVNAAGDTEFAGEQTKLATNVPTICNADTLGVRSDLVNRPITSWADLFSSDFRGKAALVNVPGTGILDAANALEAMGERTYADKGNMTRDEIDFTINRLIDLKKDGHFRAFWSTFDESVNLMAAGEVVIQSMWAPAVTAVKARGIPCVYQGLKEGYRGWGNGLSLMGHLDGLKLDAAYEYMNWFLSGWQGGFIARQGYYSTVPETARENMTEDEWGYWYEGKPAAGDILDPYGAVMDKAGASRDGGSYEDRMGNIVCWNTVMDEERYMVQRWNEFVSS